MKNRAVLALGLALFGPAPAHASEPCTDYTTLGAEYCYAIEGTTAENCGTFFKQTSTKWKFCKWDESKSKCRGKGGVKTDVVPACAAKSPPSSPSPPTTPPPPSMPPASPPECMYAIEVGFWCGSVTDMTLCPKSYQQFLYEGEMKYKGCAVVGDKCKGKGTVFGTTMPETCDDEELLDEDDTAYSY